MSNSCNGSRSHNRVPLHHAVPAPRYSRSISTLAGKTATSRSISPQPASRLVLGTSSPMAPTISAHPLTATRSAGAGKNTGTMWIYGAGLTRWRRPLAKNNNARNPRTAERVAMLRIIRTGERRAMVSPSCASTVKDAHAARGVRQSGFFPMRDRAGSGGKPGTPLASRRLPRRRTVDFRFSPVAMGTPDGNKCELILCRRKTDRRIADHGDRRPGATRRLA